MKKSLEVEGTIKRAIRDELALYPLKSISQIQATLYKQGYGAVHGPLDWHYVNKLTKRIRLENLSSLFAKDRSERFTQLKERHRTITEKLAEIVDGKASSGLDKLIYPSPGERITAANTILKWDLALFFAEEQVRVIEKSEKTFGDISDVNPFTSDIEPSRDFFSYPLRNRALPSPT